MREWFATTDLCPCQVRSDENYATAETRLSPLHTDFDSMSDTEKGSYEHSTTAVTKYEGDLSVTYGKLFREVHMLNLVGGFNFSNTESTRNGYKAIGFTEDQFGAPSLPMVIRMVETVIFRKHHACGQFLFEWWIRV